MRIGGPFLGCAIALLGGCGRSTPPRPSRNYVVVSNEGSDSVTVLDADRDEVAFTIPVGKRPRGIRASRDGKLLFVATSGTPKGGGPGDEKADGIVVVDLDRREIVRTLPAGHDPEAFDLTPDGKKLYVSNEDRGEVSVVDVEAGRVLRSVKVGGEPEGVTISPDGRFAYVATEASNEVHVIATDSDTVVARVPTAARPRAIAFSRDGSRAMVTAENGGSVHVLDASRAELSRVPTGPAGARPMGVAFAPDGTRAFVANGREGSVAVVDVAAGRVERSIPNVGARPWGLDVSRDGKKLYVAASPDVAVIDVAQGAVIKRLPVGSSPWGVVTAGKGS